MEKEKAIEIFNKWMDCKDAYQADPSCDGNCFSCEYYASAEGEKEAMLLAISALKKQERWIPVTERLPEKEGCYLVTVKNDHERRYSKTAWYCGDGWFARQDIIAWRLTPEPYTEEEA